MTAAILFDAVPLLQQYFPSRTLVQQVQDTPILIAAMLTLCMAVAFLALWRAAPDYRVFRSLGIFFSASTIIMFLLYLGAQIPYLSARAVTTALVVEVAGEAMRVPRRRWTHSIWPISLFAAVAVWFPSMAFFSDWLIYISAVFLLILIVQGFRHGNPRDRMVAAAFSIYFVVRLLMTSGFQKLTGISDMVDIGGWRWPKPAFLQVLLGAATLVIFVRDLIRDRSEKQRMAAELAAGRAIQQVLIPDETPTIPGFNIQSFYKPFGEVGGDFFQVLPVKNGGVLIVIGDVSGKGMPAAMTVSLLVGTLRTLAHYTQSPGEFLTAMNHRMLARSQGGFTTCLVLRADPGGQLTIANAGHIAPYLDGKELALENGLPLGLSAESTYAESTFQLPPTQQLTLLTDGVVEARDKSGALCGFDRTAAISGQSADQIAKAAELFGQDDDITVLTMARTA